MDTLRFLPAGQTAPEERPNSDRCTRRCTRAVGLSATPRFAYRRWLAGNPGGVSLKRDHLGGQGTVAHGRVLGGGYSLQVGGVLSWNWKSRTRMKIDNSRLASKSADERSRSDAAKGRHAGWRQLGWQALSHNGSRNCRFSFARNGRCEYIKRLHHPVHTCWQAGDHTRMGRSNADRIGMDHPLASAVSQFYDGASN
jgi:hypothetical protein